MVLWFLVRRFHGSKYNWSHFCCYSFKHCNLSKLTASLIDGSIKVASRSVRVALTHSALVRVVADRRPPRKIVEEVATALAVQTFGVVHALAATVHLKTDYKRGGRHGFLILIVRETQRKSSLAPKRVG